MAEQTRVLDQGSRGVVDGSTFLERAHSGGSDFDVGLLAKAASSSAFDRLSSVPFLQRICSSILDDKRVEFNQQNELPEDRVRIVQELSESLRGGNYLHRAAGSRCLSKHCQGEVNSLTGDALKDRIVERAFFELLVFELDFMQSSSSFAYRKGVEITDVVRHVLSLREEGCEHVAHLRIENFLSKICVDTAFDSLPNALQEPRFLSLLHRVIDSLLEEDDREINIFDDRWRASLLALVANISLTEIDNVICDDGFGYARFGNEILLCAPRKPDLSKALNNFLGTASSRGLIVDEEKIHMSTFDEGFCFLDVTFANDRPSVGQLTDSQSVRDLDKVVYVGKDGSRIHVGKGRLIVDGSGGLPLMSIPQRTVTRIVLVGNVGMSAGARSWALYNDIDVICLSRRGGYLGQLAGPRSTVNARRLLAQAEFSANEEARLPLAGAIVRAKLRNQLHVLNRTTRRSAQFDLRSSCREIRVLMNEVRYAESIDELMGIEGAASASYFNALAGLVPEDVSFNGRTRRPPRDLANAALSYCYAILLSECTGALLSAGLEPSLGILHSSTDKRPSLALDLMEEFRPLLVDSTVLALLRMRRLRPEHATIAANDGGGVWLTPLGKKAVVDGYEATMQRRVKGALPGFAGSWRRHIHHEAQLLARAIMEPDYRWIGVAWR